MRTLNVAIPEAEFEKLGLEQETISFSELMNLINREITRQNWEKNIQLAEKYGLSEMTMEEITNEVETVRNNAKNRR